MMGCRAVRPAHSKRVDNSDAILLDKFPESVISSALFYISILITDMPTMVIENHYWYSSLSQQLIKKLRYCCNGCTFAEYN